MHDRRYILLERDIQRFGLPTAFVLTWLRARRRARCILLSADDIAALGELTEEKIEDLATLGLLTFTPSGDGWAIELLIDDPAPTPEAARELRQQGLKEQDINDAFIWFTHRVHTEPASVLAEYYRSLPHETLGPERAFVRFALQYHALARPSAAPPGGWAPQIRTVQMLMKEGIAMTFIQEKRLQFGDALRSGGERYQRPSPDHHFLDYCRKAWSAAASERKQLECQLSRHAG